MSVLDGSRIVSNGRSELLRSPEYALAVEEVRERVARDFAPLIADAGFIRRQVFRIKRWSRTRREVENLAPRGALYASHGTRSRRRS